MAPAPYESEVTFLCGVDEQNTAAEVAYPTWKGANPADYEGPSEAIKWGSSTPGTGATVTYCFTAASDWDGEEQGAWRGGLALWSAVANITFIEIHDPGTANFVITRGTDGGAHASFGSQTTVDIDSPTISTPGATGSVVSIDTTVDSFGPIGLDLTAEGGYPLSTAVHEIGHIIGLGHGGPYNAAVNESEQQFSAYDTTLWTLMSYINPDQQNAKFFNDYPVKGASWAGNDPLTPMMLDILAVQRLYGAATSGPLTGGNHTFGFNSNIQGYIGRFYDFNINQAAVVTLWENGTNNTLDLSGFTQNATINLAPGTFSSVGGHVNNLAIAVGTIIGTAIGGSGNDTITASNVSSTLYGRGGSDVLYGGAGNDTLRGGAGPDTIHASTGRDTLRDTLEDMNGDTVFDFGLGTTVDIVGSQIGRANLEVTHSAGTTTISAGGSAILLEGAFGDGDFMTVVRGSGENAHTMVTFETFLPALFEGVRVAPEAINGMTNEPFATGDGAIRFTLNLKSAVSEYSNTLGFYKVGTDGTIFDVDVVYANTLNVTAAQWTVDLGTPGNGERIGFFLIQDGFDFYGGLPDNLSFVTPGTLTPADLDAGLPPVLRSATLGLLTSTVIFHSFQTLNPGDALQVLSGVAPGGRELLIGFEDLPSATGDNDFQDVVIGVRTNHDDIFIL